MITKKQWIVGILLFNEVEVLDFAGPFEVFSITTLPESDKKPFIVKTISETKNIISARNGLKIKPDYNFNDNVNFDILIIPGGYGAEEIEINNVKVIEWIKNQFNKVQILASVCTGSFLLGKTGLLDNKNATTHWMDIKKFQDEFPKIKVHENVKYIDEDKIITSGGVSAGINMSFYIIKKLLNKEIAQNTAKRMEYDVII
ncbi:class I glutamine amidotransferase-like protein [Lichtheimia hyalospora FSU 10163]|nr:class I glutamine amidotransferase-like protein [Lichtheimia hyalospora FSU 10163]